MHWAVILDFSGFFALFAVGDDEALLRGISGRLLAWRRGRRRTLAEAAAEICEDMPYSEVAATAPLSIENSSSTF